MDCTKTWDLMMKKVDGAASETEAVKLDGHLSECGACAEAFRSLRFALDGIRDADPKAPEGLEAGVMAKLSLIDQKEKLKMLPYALSPVIALLAILAFYLFNTFRLSPISMMDETARLLSFVYKLLDAVVAVGRYLMRVLYVRELLFAAMLFAITGLVAYLFKNRKNPAGGFSWRVSK